MRGELPQNIKDVIKRNQMVSSLWGGKTESFFLVPPEERRHLSVTAPMLRKELEPCGTPTVSISAVFAYKAKEMVDVNEEGRISGKRDVFLRVDVVDHCVMVIMEFLKRAWPRSSEQLKAMSIFDPEMIESRHGVHFPVPAEVIGSVCLVVVRQIISGTRFSPRRAFATIVRACAISWTRPGVVERYRYDFMTVDFYVDFLRSNKQLKTCSGSVTHGQIKPVKLEGEDQLRAVTEKVQRETALAAAKQRCMWDRASKARTKRTSAR